MSGRGKLTLLLVIAAIAGVYGLYTYVTKPMTIMSALHDGRVAVQIESAGASDSKATITLTRTNEVSGDLTVVIPVGTVITNDDPSGQRLMTAVPVTIHLSSNENSVRQEVETYCVDEFAATPTTRSALSFPVDSESSTTEETEPLHQLANCLANSSEPHFNKQLAVWLVSGNLIRMAPGEAIDAVTKALEKRIGIERRAKLEGEGRDMIRSKHPSLTDADIDALIEAELQHEAERIHNTAVTAAKEQFADFRQYGKGILEACGYKSEDMPVFQ